MAEQLLFEFEEWRKIESWPDYEVSSLGRVKLMTKRLKVGPGYILKPSPKIRDGRFVYMYVCLNGKTVPVHRLVCLAFHGSPPPGKPETAHWDGDPANNVASNLRWASHAENMADLKRHGKHRGEIHKDAKLTEADVRIIKRRIANGEKYSPISRDYGVNPGSISLIASGRNWAWVKD